VSELTTLLAFVFSENEAVQRYVIIGGVILVAALISNWLFNLSQRTSQEGYQRKVTGGGPSTGQSALHTAIFTPALTKELDRLPRTGAQRAQMMKAVTSLVDQAVQERVSGTTRELDERYGQVIEEQRKEKTVLQQKYQDTLQEHKQTEAVLQSIAEGLVVVNNQGNVIMMNPAAERLLAVTQKDRIGKPLMDNLKDEQLVSLVKESKDGEREIVLSAKQDATKRVLRASNAVIADEDGNTVGMVAVLSDVTKQRELDHLKSEFVAKVSHELRTPLVAMKHALSILTDQVAGPLTDEQQKFASISQRNLERLNLLINDLLDLSKLEAKKMELRPEAGPVLPMIRGVCESLEAWAGTKAVTLAKRVPEDLPEAMFDKSRVTQVLTNLVGNAIKFTPKQGRITIEAKVGAGGDVLELSVSDTGPGIAKDDLPKLFNKFQQVGERAATDMSGTGLGLAISKEIIDLHHGRIWAESDAQQGARFIFTIPMAAGSPG
jgi:two-component system sensor histidine kinase VicK